MAILYTKKQPRKFGGAGKLDNITYLMNKADKNTKKTPEQMQAIADKMNSQARTLGINTVTKVWPEGKIFNPRGLDYNDDVVLIGDNVAQMDYIRNSNLPGKGTSYDFDGFNMGVGVSPGAYRDFDTFVPSVWGAVRTDGARNFAKSTGVNESDAIAYLANHERGHNFSSIYPTLDGHAIKPGLMTSGTGTMGNIKKGFSLQDLLNPELIGNKQYIDDIIYYRQFGDPNRPAKDNYDENIRTGNLRPTINGDIAPMSVIDRQSKNHTDKQKWESIKPFIPKTAEEREKTAQIEAWKKKLTNQILNL